MRETPLRLLPHSFRLYESDQIFLEFAKDEVDFNFYSIMHGELA
jgi:hypothetical protein